MTVQDLTAIEKPYGLLDAKTKLALLRHGGPYDLFTAGSGWVPFNDPREVFSSTSWVGYYGSAIRVRPATKPSIDWSHVAEGFNWLARDEDGEPFLYSHCPSTGSMSWHSNGFMRDARIFASYTPGTCSWQDSLVCRPGHEGDAA